MLADLWYQKVLRSETLYQCFLRTGQVRVSVRPTVRASYDATIDDLARPSLRAVTFTRGPRGQVLADFAGEQSEVEPPRACLCGG